MKLLKIDRKFLLVSIVILAVFIVSRFIYIGVRPIHHDEGMLAYFAYQLAENKSYIYTPQIHGPVLFYLTALILKFSLSNVAVRASMAIVSILLGLSALLLLKKESKAVAYSVAVSFLISPLLIYFSRFLVHTGIVILFNFCFVVSLRNFFIKNKSIDLFLAAGFLALAFGTSETSYIFVAILVLFIPLFWLVDRNKFREIMQGLKKFARTNIFDILSSVLIFSIVWLLIYSVGLTNLESLRISLPNPFQSDTSLGFWLAQHKVRLGGQPWFYYLLLAVVYELLALVAFLIYIPRVFINKKPFEFFLVWWTVGSFIGFSWAGEKFPWLFMPSLLPLTFSAGYFIANYWNESAKYLKIIFAVLFVWTIFVGIRLNYFWPYDTRELPTYVQTPKVFEELENRIEKTCEGKTTDCVVIDSKITWPMAWDLNRINRLEDFSDNSQIVDETKFMLVDPASVVKSEIENKFNKSQIQLRDWWVPQKYTDFSTLIDYWNYFISRKIWNDKGGFDINLYERQ